jgi:AraC-like DNA-binding protein
MNRPEVQYYKRFNLELFEGRLDGHKYPWHFHECYTVIIVHEGALRYVYKDREQEVRQGEVYVVNPFESHYNFPLGACTYRAIFLPPASLQTRGCSPQFIGKGVSHPAVFLELNAIFEQIRQHCPDLRSCKAMERQLAQLLRNNLAYRISTEIVDTRMARAIDFMKQHLDHKLTIAVIAESCHLSKFHFQRLFKESTGLTVNAYIQQLRTEQAKNLLTDGLSVLETGLETGYFDQSHFHKAFKRMWATWPSRF